MVRSVSAGLAIAAAAVALMACESSGNDASARDADSVDDGQEGSTRDDCNDGLDDG